MNFKPSAYLVVFLLCLAVVFGLGPGIWTFNVNATNINSTQVNASFDVCITGGNCLSTITGFVFPNYFNQGVNTTSNVSFNFVNNTKTRASYLNATNTTNTNTLEVNRIKFVQPIQFNFNNCTQFEFNATPKGADNSWVVNQNITYQLSDVGYDNLCGSGNSCFQPYDDISVTTVSMAYTSPHHWSTPGQTGYPHSVNIINISFNATANGIYPVNITLKYSGGSPDCNINVSVLVGSQSNQLNTITGSEIYSTNNTLHLNFPAIYGADTLTNFYNLNYINAQTVDALYLGGMSADNLQGLLGIYGYYDSSGVLQQAGQGSGKIQNLNMTGALNVATVINVTSSTLTSIRLDTPNLNVRQNATVKGNLTVTGNLSVANKWGITKNYYHNATCSLNFTNGILTNISAGCS